MPAAPSSTSTKDAFGRLLDGLQTLMREHVALARAEIKDEARSMARDALVSAAGVPALLAGYLLLMFAIGYLLALWLPQWAAFAIVAVANLIAGSALTAGGLKKLSRDKVAMRGTGEEIQRDKEWLASLKSGDSGERGEAPLPNRSLQAQSPAAPVQ